MKFWESNDEECEDPFEGMGTFLNSDGEPEEEKHFPDSSEDYEEDEPEETEKEVEEDEEEFERSEGPNSVWF